MPHPTLSEIIDGRMIASDSEIHATDDEPVRAIDVLEFYAAVYRFSAGADGDWYASCTLAKRCDDGSWSDRGSSGTRGVDLQLPWRPSSRTLNGHTVAIFGSGGVDVGEDRSIFLRSIFGFADPSVSHLRISAATLERIIEVCSPVGAFVVVALGEGAVDLQGLSDEGQDVGKPAVAKPIGDPARPRFRRRHWQTRGWRFGRS